MAELDPPNFDPRQSIDAYCDDQMPADMRARFEEQIVHEPALRDAIARQREIDQSLKRMFTPALGAGADAILAQLTPQHAASNGKVHYAQQPVSRRKFVRMPLAIAAALVFLLCGPFAIWNTWETFHQPKSIGDPKPVRPLDVAYREEVKNGFNCDWECKSQSEFGAYFAAGFSQPLVMKDPPAEIVPVGLKYTGGITPNTLTYMAKVQGQPVMVFTDKIESDSGQTLANPKGLHIYKRTIGPLVLYEVSPLDHSTLLDLFYTP
jgi:hypothetical protein